MWEDWTPVAQAEQQRGLRVERHILLTPHHTKLEAEAPGRWETGLRPWAVTGPWSQPPGDK